MIGDKTPRLTTLLRLGAGVALRAALMALATSGPTAAAPATAPTEPLNSTPPETITYVIGYVLALLLTIAAFALVRWHWAPPTTALGIVFGLAFLQMLVHFRCFLHVTLRGAARDDLALILFSTLIVLLMVGGTLVVLFNLRLRMM